METAAKTTSETFALFSERVNLAITLSVLGACSEVIANIFRTLYLWISFSV